MPVTHDNGGSRSSGRAFSLGRIRHFAAEPGRVSGDVSEVLNVALRRHNAERRGMGVTEAGFDNRLDRGEQHD